MAEINLYGSLESQTCSHGDDCALETKFVQHRSIAECQQAKQLKREAIQKKIDELVGMDIEGKISELQAQLASI